MKSAKLVIVATVMSSGAVGLPPSPLVVCSLLLLETFCHDSQNLIYVHLLYPTYLRNRAFYALQQAKCSTINTRDYEYREEMTLHVAIITVLGEGLDWADEPPLG